MRTCKLLLKFVAKARCGGTFLLDLILCIFNVIVNITCICHFEKAFTHLYTLSFFQTLYVLMILYHMHVSCSFSIVAFSWELDLTKTFSMMEKTLKHYEN